MNIKQDGITPNAGRLLWAGFMAILAAGVGFGIRGGILANWRAEFGFTAVELGKIGGAGLTGFCFGIIIGGVIVDKIGYGKLVFAAFAFHALSAFVTLAAHPEQAQMTAYQFLFWGTFIFAIANGTLEAVANPLVATLFPNNRTHYLNILHASWPAGLVIGGLVGWTLGESGISWKWLLALYLIPTAVYGWMFLGQRMPKSEASQKGVSFSEMFHEIGLLGGTVVAIMLGLFFNSIGVVGATGVILVVILMITHTHGKRGDVRVPLGVWLIFVMFITHALVGAVELGTDSWAQNITGNILTSAEGKILFVFTSLIMFSLRFCADFIEKKLGLSPIGILLTCAILACVGLNLASNMTTFAGAIVALSIYAVGKTFFWPTMLAVIGDRFPKTGAVAMSIMGGVGMMSAGLIGAPGLGYAKDRFAGAALEAADPVVFGKYKAEKPSGFLFFAESTGLDGKKRGEIQEKLNIAREILEAGEVKNLDPEKLARMDERQRQAKEEEHAKKKKIEAALADKGLLKPEGSENPVAEGLLILSDEERKVHAASIEGDRKTLRADAVIPAIMALIYLGLFFYFKIIGGYKAVTISEANNSTSGIVTGKKNKEKRRE